MRKAASWPRRGLDARDARDPRDPCVPGRAATGWLRSALAVVALLAACSTASEEADSKVGPLTPPAAVPVAPEQLVVNVTVDGVTVQPITGHMLNTVKADYRDADRKAWKVDSLVPMPSGPATVIVDGERGVSLLFELPAADTPHGEPLEPALFWSRRGQLIAAGVNPSDPFPRYHGKGNRMQRLGDGQPRLVNVWRVRVLRRAAPGR